MQATSTRVARIAATSSFASSSSTPGSIHSWRVAYGMTPSTGPTSILYTPRAPILWYLGAEKSVASAAQRRWASSKSPPNPRSPYPRFTPPPTSANSPQRSSLGRSKLDAAIESSDRIAPYGPPPGISAESWANRHRSASSSSKTPAPSSEDIATPPPQHSETNKPPTPVSSLLPSSSNSEAKTEEKPKTLLDPRGHAQDYVPFIQRLIRRTSLQAPNALHRPSKEELLAAASGWWERLRIRLKWLTIRGWRRFNTDDLSAFASWFVVGNTLWILIGTTTFVSAVFATLNSLSLQEYVARWISDYMTSETGVTVIFESAIVPKWGASTITFRNVFVSRRPSDSSGTPQKSATAKPPSPVPFMSSNISPDTYLAVPPASDAENYTMFDVNLEEVEVTLSFMRWLDGKGLVKDAKVKGVRGVIDRRSVWWDMSKPLVPAEFRHPTRTGDFELESFHVEDALVTVYQPAGQKPYNLSIFNAAIGPLRKRWLFYDLLNAEGITGQMDNCLFSLHMPQKLGKANGESKRDDSAVKRMARFRIDGLPIEHAQYATGHTAPMSWITSGRVDAVLDIKFPFHPDEQVDIKAIFEEISRNVVTIAQGSHPDDAPHHAHRDHNPIAAELAGDQLNPGQARLARPPLRAPNSPDREIGASEQLAGRKVVVDIDLRFRDLKAAVPVFTSDLSVRNNAIIRPIVAFINANRTLVPIHCQVAADLSDFDGSWTLFETGLTTSISDQIYDALAYHVSSEAANSKRIRQVSFWGIQRGAEVLLDTLRTVVDPMHGQLMAAA